MRLLLFELRPAILAEIGLVNALRLRLDAVERRASELSGCVCVLLAWDEERRRFIERMRHRGVPLLVLVVRGPEEGESLAAGPMADQPGRLRAVPAGGARRVLALLSGPMSRGAPGRVPAGDGA